MVTPIDLGVIGYFIPIAAFMLVLIVIYAILQKSQVLGENSAVSLFISIIMASFFIVEVQLVDFITFTSSWFVVFVVLIFFIFIILAFFPGEKPLNFLVAKNWFSWVVLALIIVFFIISSSYIFNWAVNWDYLASGTDNEWFGFVLLLVVGGVVSWVLSRSK